MMLTMTNISPTPMLVPAPKGVVGATATPLGEPGKFRIWLDTPRKICTSRSANTRSRGIAAIPINRMKFSRYREKERSRISPRDKGRKSRVAIGGLLSTNRCCVKSRAALYQNTVARDKLLLVGEYLRGLYCRNRREKVPDRDRQGKLADQDGL